MKRFTVCLPVLLASVFAAALSSAPAYAVDGVVLINQSTATNGLPGCGSSGFPIVICQPGSYRLSGNLSVPATSGIEITSDNVTLDLNGFSISCQGPLCGFLANGISSANSGITVRNGKVQGFNGMGAAGIGLPGSDELVDHVRATNNSEGVLIGAGIVSNCVTSGNFDGIYAANALISGNSVSNNKGAGVYLVTLNGKNSVTNNIIIGNGSNVFINGGGGIVVVGFVGYGSNTFAGNTNDVLKVGAGTAVSMQNNACTSGVC